MTAMPQAATKSAKMSSIRTTNLLPSFLAPLVM